MPPTRDSLEPSPADPTSIRTPPAMGPPISQHPIMVSDPRGGVGEVSRGMKGGKEGIASLEEDEPRREVGENWELLKGR